MRTNGNDLFYLGHVLLNIVFKGKMEMWDKVMAPDEHVSQWIRDTFEC